MPLSLRWPHPRLPFCLRDVPKSSRIKVNQELHLGITTMLSHWWLRFRDMGAVYLRKSVWGIYGAKVPSVGREAGVTSTL